ncbi:MAG TPA: hypothetical protein GX715_03835 [Armatimonadetes bacterium]|jgi:polynucleotide 5'-hydroxyl-kinase GRC3/NOL9|nr:hypothetical protein [Armatimonadota bacterium]
MEPPVIMDDDARASQAIWPEETSRVLDRVAERGGTVLLLGATDTGKSVLARELLNRGVRAGKSVALVDADIGQSDIGPPATIGLGIPDAPVTDLAQVPPRRLYFVGDTTPARHLLPVVVGTSLLVAVARSRGCRLIVVDTTGMVSGRLAATLKFHKIQAVRPRCILAVQARRELEPLLQPFAHPGGPVLVRLPVAPGVRVKSPQARAENRKHAFAAYFAGAREQRLPYPRVRLWPPTHPDRIESAPRRICGLLDAHGDTLAAGILLCASGSALTVLTPLADLAQVATVQIGDLQVTPQGEELGRPARRR